jgi:hypothetical protein
LILGREFRAEGLILSLQFKARCRLSTVDVIEEAHRMIRQRS